MSEPRPAALIKLQHLAMQLLAHGDPLVHAAYQVGLDPTSLRETSGEKDFKEASTAETTVLQLVPARWDDRLDGLIRQATGRALIAAMPGTLNLLLRLRHVPAGRRVAVALAPDGGEIEDAAEDDEAAWLEGLPIVEPEPEREAERRRALARVEPKAVRRTIGHAPLRSIEQYLVAGDPVAYEEWFARQPKPPRQPANLSEADRAAVEHVTRNNPPWIRGEYLGYHRPPVPAHLFEPEARFEPATPAASPGSAAAPPTIATPLADLRARVARLLDRRLPRRLEELDLAEAICALKWPKWPAYRGTLDLGLLRRALAGFALADGTLSWLGSRELADACRAAKPP